MSGRMQNIRLSFRVQVSMLLIIFSVIAWIIPDRHRSAFELSPSQMIEMLKSGEQYLSCDQVARVVVNETPSIQLIDIRPSTEFLSSHIPGSINIPFEEILNPDWSGYLDDPSGTSVLYSNGTTLASEAWVLCTQVGYPNIKVMQGGLNEWYKVVMESEFSGGRITAAENALFEVRYMARDYFTTLNSLPDSLKTVFLEVKKKKEAELVGGCE